MMVERLPECNAGLTLSTSGMTASWRSSPCGPRPPPSPSVSEQVAEAQRVRHLQERRIVLRVGQHPLFPPAPRGLGMDVETAVYLRPRQVGLLLEPHQAIREVGWEARGSSAVMNALSRHGIAGPPGTQPEPLSNAGASTAFPRPPQTVGVPFSGRYACLIRLSICAGFFRCPLLARTADGRHQLVGQHPAVARAEGSPGVAVLDTCYGAAGVWVWNQRERSLTPPCSLMALIR